MLMSNHSSVLHKVTPLVINSLGDMCSRASETRARVIITPRKKGEVILREGTVYIANKLRGAKKKLKKRKKSNF